MCASVATDMCGLSNPILCCLFLSQVNYVYVYFKKRIKRTHPRTHTHRTTVKLWGTHHSVAQWDECDRVMHTEKISETMTPQSEAYNFVLCSFGSTNKTKQKKALCGISARAGCMAPSSFRSPHAWLRRETCGTVINTELKKKKKIDSEVGWSVCTHVKRPKVTAANVSDTRGGWDLSVNKTPKRLVRSALLLSYIKHWGLYCAVLPAKPGFYSTDTGAKANRVREKAGDVTGDAGH